MTAGKEGELLQYHGSLVALEGNHDTVSTQLRLLPNSASILTLPPLRYFMKEGENQPVSDAQSCILRTHEACKARVAMAHSFLRESLPNSKRIVVMNGGTASAQLECITAISKSHTDGDTAKAQSLFNELVRDGVAGLKRRNTASQESSPGSSQETESSAKTINGTPEDPMTRVMRAADALDEKTASLQESNEIDLTIASRRRSMSAPSPRFSNDYGKTTPFYIFGQPAERGQTHLAKQLQSNLQRNSVLFGPCENYTTDNLRAVSKEPKTTPGVQPDHGVESRRPSRTEELYNPRTPKSISAIDLISPRTGRFDSPLNTPTVVYGEATIVDVRPGEKLSVLQRTKSFDDIHAGGIDSRRDSRRTSHPRLVSTSAQRRGLSRIVTSTFEQPNGQVLRSRFYHEQPRMEHFKPSKSIVRKNVPSRLDLKRSQEDIQSTPTKTGTSTKSGYVDEGTWIGPCYVDRGSDAGEINLGILEEADLAGDTAFETVLPMVEDLVIYFKDGNGAGDSLFESIIRGFKDGAYPISTAPEDVETDNDTDTPGTPTSQQSGPVIEQKPLTPPPTNAACRIDADDYDPFAAHGDYLHPPGLLPGKKRADEQKQLTVIPTPPSSTHSNDKSFHELSTVGLETAVCIQNALRSALNIYFPPRCSGYYQFNFPSLPELDSVWKPVFREVQAGDCKIERRKIDLIVAVGAQAGVGKDFLSSITSSLEKLGTKPNGTKRSGRLDLRYLIANAMQSFTSQPLANQIRDNPFCNSLLLATLVIPHLEIYMAAHSDVRFLILEYPPDHLSTVLAMQQLVGADLLRVAGILNTGPELRDPNSSRPPSSSRSQQSSPVPTSMSSSSNTPAATLRFSPGRKPSETPSFSKANFLLTSIATESETATFISTIWKLLIGISPFYIPDGAPRSPAPPLSRQISSSVHEKASTLFVDSGPEYPPLAAAATAIMSSFPKPPPSPARATFGEDFSSPSAPPPPPRPATPRHYHPDRPTTARSVVAARSPDAKSIKSVRTARTARSQKIYRMLGKEAALAAANGGVDLRSESRPGTAVSYFDDDSSDDEERFREDERKYMPLFLMNLRRTHGGGEGPGEERERRRGNSRKALKWLGLA